MTEAKKEPSPPRPATTVLLLRPSVKGDANSPLEVFMVVRHHAIDSFSGALVFPGGKLEDADGDEKLRARCGGAEKISPTSSSSASPACARRSRNAACCWRASAASER